MQKLYNIASLGLLWLAFFNFSGAKSELNPNLASDPAMSSNNLLFELACQDTINVLLDLNCQFELTVDNLFSSDLPDCLSIDDLQILVDDPQPANGPLVDDCGFWTFYIGLIDPNECTTFTSCWGVIRAEDKTPPEVRVPADQSFLLSCQEIDTILNNPYSLELTGIAETRDNCDLQWKSLKNFNDLIVDYDVCKDIQIKRTFFTQDEKGNQAQEVQTITLTRPTLDIVKIEELFELDTICGYVETLPKDAQGNIHPSVTGYPFYINEFGEKIELNAETCGLGISYVDQRFDFCVAAFKIERLWTIADWCSGEEKTLTQLIKIGDLKGPEITFPQDTYQISTGPFACEGSIEAIQPQVNDICSAVSIQVALYSVTEDFRGEKKNTFKQSLPLDSNDERVFFNPEPVGNYLLIYTVRDACKNTTLDTIEASITDKVKPIAKCIDALNVTINNFGYAQVSSIDINEGSTDNCALDSLQIRRLLVFDEDCEPLDAPSYSQWGDLVFFNCCDLTQIVEVVLRVVDKSGNESQCWSNVLIEDKEIPTCHAPENIRIDCDSLSPAFDFNDPAKLAVIFGMATGQDACSEVTVEELAVKNELSDCGFGEITRSFIVYDELGRVSTNKCEQVITVNPVHNYEIKFPLDYTTVCAEPEPDSLLVTSYGCDLLAVYNDDTKLTAEGEECFKIFRKYQVINWCEYDGLSDPYIVPRDIDCDGIPGDEDIYVLVRPDNKVYFDANNNERDSFPTQNFNDYDCYGLDYGNPNGYWIGTDSFPAITSRGFWEYTQIIKVQDTIAPTIIIEDTVSFCINRADCEAEVVVSFAIIDECVDGNVTIRTYIEDGSPANEFVEYDEDPWDIVGRYPKYLMSGIVPEGSYRIEIEADDQCGNVTKVQYTLQVVDCKPPALICRDGLVVELMPLESDTDADGDGDTDAGANTVWATDFIARMVEDDCSGPVDYSINRKGSLPDRSQKALTLTCDDPEVLEVEVYAWDNANNPFSIQPNGLEGGANYDFCNNFIEVQDNNQLCEPLGDIDIAGTIISPKGAAMPNIEVRLSGASSRQVMTNSNGEFYMNGLIEGYDYSIFPQKRTDLLEGVSTLDIIYITKHILGIEPFNDPYQLLAADLNRSNSVSTLDVILLRKAILNVDQDAMDLAGWRFIDAKHQFNNPSKPWAQNISEVISLNNIAFDQGGLDFIALKMGDVSGLLAPRSQTAHTTNLILEDLLLEPGSLVKIPLYINELTALEGLQFGLSINPELATLVQVENALFTEGNFNWKKDRQALLLSWDRYQSAFEDVSKEPLLYLDLKIEKSARLSELITLDPRLLHPESYAENQIKGIDLKWQKAADNQLLAKVFPNPFQNELNIALDQGWDRKLPIYIQLYGLEGKLILQKTLPAQNWDGSLINLEIATELNHGIYLLKISQQHKSLNFKVLK